METSRRAFLGSTLAAAVPLTVAWQPLVATGAATAPGGVLLRTAAKAKPSRRPADPVLRELLKQSHRATRALVKGTRRAEAARQHALVLRTLAAHGAAIGLNDLVAREIRARFAAEGRTPLLTAPGPDLQALAARLASEGFDVGNVSHVRTIPTDPSTRSQAVAMLLAGRTTEAFQGLADEFDTLADRLDQTGLVANRRQDCGGVQFLINLLQIHAAIFCTPYLIAIPEICLVVMLELIALQTANLIWC
jgi:hypothetical protein